MGCCQWQIFQLSMMMCVSDAQHALSEPRSTHAGLPSPQILQSIFTFQDPRCNTVSGPVANQVRPPAPHTDSGPDQTTLPETMGPPTHPFVTHTWPCGSASQPAATFSAEPQETHRCASLWTEFVFTYLEYTVILLPLACKGDDNSCNLSLGPLSSPPKQSKTSVASPRKLGFDENSPVTARRQLLPLSPPHANSPAPSSPRRQETPFKSPARTNFKGKSSDAHPLNKGKSYSSL